MSCEDYLSCYRQDDDGVPPCCACTSTCPLHHKNILNHCWLTEFLSTFGFPVFDDNRKLFFGIASILTLFSIIISIFGCISLAKYPSVQQKVYWASANVHNNTSDEDFGLYINLRSSVYVNCPFKGSYQSYGSGCSLTSVSWSANSCSNSVLSASCHSCSDSQTNLFLTTTGACLGLMFGFIGSQTRMRIIADVPIQKLLGIAMDALVTISLVYAIIIFTRDCVNPLKKRYEDEGLRAQFVSGPGIYCFAVSAGISGLKVILHVLTPLPGRDSCCCGPPPEAPRISLTKEPTAVDRETLKDSYRTRISEVKIDDRRTSFTPPGELDAELQDIHIY